MKHLLGSAFIALLFLAPLNIARAQAEPALPVQGVAKSVADDGKSFVVTVKKKDVTVAITPDTRFAFDDAPSTLTAAIVPGRDVNAILTADGTSAFIVVATSASAKGTVKSLAADGKSAVIADKKGDVTVKLGDSTKYILGKNPSTAAVAMAPDNTVIVDIGTDGVATTVTAKPSKIGKTPATPATPAVPGIP